MRQLPAESATSRALNGGVSPLSRLENFVADLWALQARKDHPVRAEMQARARNEKKQARVIELKSKFQTLKRTYGLEDSA